MAQEVFDESRNHSIIARSPFQLRLGIWLVIGLLLFVHYFRGPDALASEPVRSIFEQRNELVIRQNFDLSCGAAALATLLVYQHGEDLTEREVAIGLISRDIYMENPLIVKARQGFSLLDMKRYVELKGYEGQGLGRLSLADIDALAPIILPLDIMGYRHFVVFRGTLGDRVLLADPAYGTRTMKIRRFLAAWIDFAEIGHTGFIVRRRDHLIPPNQLAPRPVEFPSLQ